MKPQVISRTLAHMLRHSPHEYGLVLAEGGWVELSEVVRALQARGGEWETITLTEIVQAVLTKSQGRYEISNGRIRALYGHSVQELPETASAEPPELLYHGTTPDAAEAILQGGIRPMSRSRVHLGAELDEAVRVARRHTKTPVLLEVRARDAHTAGVRFYPGSDRIWTADSIPASFLRKINDVEAR